MEHFWNHWRPVVSSTRTLWTQVRSEPGAPSTFWTVRARRVILSGQNGLQQTTERIVWFPNGLRLQLYLAPPRRIIRNGYKRFCLLSSFFENTLFYDSIPFILKLYTICAAQNASQSILSSAAGGDVSSLKGNCRRWSHVVYFFCLPGHKTWIYVAC